MDNKLFIFSGLSSITLYAGLLFIIFMNLLKTDSSKLYSAEKATVFEVSITQREVEDVAPPKPVEQEVKKQEEIVEKIGGNTMQEVTDINSLFDEVEENIIKENSKEVNSVKKTVVSTKLGKLKTRESNDAQNLLSSLKATENRVYVETNDGEVDEYFSKVHEIIASRWNPQDGEEGLSTKIVLNIDKYGKLTAYEILDKSGNTSFDKRFVNFLESLKKISFGLNDKDSTIKFVFKVKDK